MKFRKRTPAKLRRLHFEFGGEEIDVEYNFIKSAKAFNRLRDKLDASDVDTQKQAMIEALTASTAKWNLKHDEGDTLPIKAESFDHYPGTFINVFFEVLAEDVHKFAEGLPKRR